MYVCICFSYQIEKAIVPYKELQTTDGARTAEVEFQAMLVNLPEVANGQNRYITAGLEYGDSTYIWVGQASITTKATMKTMDVSLCWQIFWILHTQYMSIVRVWYMIRLILHFLAIPAESWIYWWWFSSSFRIQKGRFFCDQAYSIFDKPIIFFQNWSIPTKWLWRKLLKVLRIITWFIWDNLLSPIP